MEDSSYAWVWVAICLGEKFGFVCCLAFDFVVNDESDLALIFSFVNGFVKAFSVDLVEEFDDLVVGLLVDIGFETTFLSCRFGLCLVRTFDMNFR